MKQFSAILLTFALLFALSACAASADPDNGIPAGAFFADGSFCTVTGTNTLYFHRDGESWAAPCTAAFRWVGDRLYWGDGRTLYSGGLRGEQKTRLWTAPATMKIAGVFDADGSLLLLLNKYSGSSVAYRQFCVFDRSDRSAQLLSATWLPQNAPGFAGAEHGTIYLRGSSVYTIAGGALRDLVSLSSAPADTAAGIVAICADSPGLNRSAGAVLDGRLYLPAGTGLLLVEPDGSVREAPLPSGQSLIDVEAAGGAVFALTDRALLRVDAAGNLTPLSAELPETCRGMFVSGDSAVVWGEREFSEISLQSA